MSQLQGLHELRGHSMIYHEFVLPYNISMILWPMHQLRIGTFEGLSRAQGLRNDAAVIGKARLYSKMGGHARLIHKARAHVVRFPGSNNLRASSVR